MPATKLKMPNLPWGILLAEAVLIILSVLLALGVDSWREARQQRALADRALSGFVDEARANCSVIESVSGYHRAVLADERKPQGIWVGLLRNDAWEVVKTTGAAAWMDYDIVADLSEISAHQADHREIVRAYLQALFAGILAAGDDPDWHREGERGVISELVRIQDRLLESYQALQQQLSRRADRALSVDGAICPEGPAGHPGPVRNDDAIVSPTAQ